jgi:hypothetical protein
MFFVCLPTGEAFSETEVMAATQKVVVSTKQPVWHRFQSHGRYCDIQNWSILAILTKIIIIIYNK